MLLEFNISRRYNFKLVYDAYEDIEDVDLLSLKVYYMPERDCCDIQLDLEDHYGVPQEHIYFNRINLTGSEERDVKRIVKAIEDACSCY